MASPNNLVELSDLIKKKNFIDTKISSVINRPALLGHAGEYIASKIFDIQLNASASFKAIDGHFKSGPLKDKSINIKWYGKQES